MVHHPGHFPTESHRWYTTLGISLPGCLLFPMSQFVSKIPFIHKVWKKRLLLLLWRSKQSSWCKRVGVLLMAD